MSASQESLFLSNGRETIASYLIRHHEALQVCYARGELDNEGIKGYLPKKRKEDNF